VVSVTKREVPAKPTLLIMLLFCQDFHILQIIWVLSNLGVRQVFSGTYLLRHGSGVPVGEESNEYLATVFTTDGLYR
jgi:hypothetical protein